MTWIKVKYLKYLLNKIMTGLGLSAFDMFDYEENNKNTVITNAECPPIEKIESVNVVYDISNSNVKAVYVNTIDGSCYRVDSFIDELKEHSEFLDVTRELYCHDKTYFNTLHSIELVNAFGSNAICLPSGKLIKISDSVIDELTA